MGFHWYPVWLVPALLERWEWALPVSGYVILALVLFVGGAMKGATGIGLPIIAVPVLAAYFDLHFAVAVILLPSLATNGWLVWRYGSERPPGYFLYAIPVGALAGIALGVALLASLPDRLLNLGVAAAIFVFVIFRIARPEWRLSEKAGRVLSLPAMFLSGLMQGATGISAPIVMMYLSSLRMERGQFIFCVSLVFFVAGVAQVPAMAVAGLFGPTEMLLSLLALIPSMLGIPAGDRIARAMSVLWFDRVIMALLVALAIKLAAS